MYTVNRNGLQPAEQVSTDWADVRNLLVLRLDNIGDVIMLGPALRAIKAALPHTHLTLLASPGGAQAASLLPWVDEVLSWRVLWQDLGQLSFDPAREWSLVETLQRKQFDGAIVFTSFSQTPHPPAFVCYLAGIPRRLGESKETAGALLTAEVPAAPDELHQTERNLRLIESIGIPVDDRSLEIRIPKDAYAEAAHLLDAHGLSIDTPYVLSAPWASCQARTYSPERAGAAARQIAEAAELPVVLVGAPRDRERCGPVLDQLGEDALDLVGETSVPAFAALVAHSRLVLTNNTSALHLADATRTPIVVTYSGTEYESQWCPRNTPSRLLRRPTWCSPCYAFTCPYDHECLDIPPEEVADAALDLLTETTSSGTSQNAS